MPTKIKKMTGGSPWRNMSHGKTAVAKGTSATLARTNGSKLQQATGTEILAMVSGRPTAAGSTGVKMMRPTTGGPAKTPKPGQREHLIVSSLD